ncbi:hypothetical protein FGO68_gene8325 [Halteria grandinella]|uniref:tRNA dimethylallyltransferase n=1 Tax=Halteria grandinella TaxID=5974 RepID=A0A8J8NQA0_HALGN|nr:hypothetical protein FGO68_gene8325 [Halteria grandinella]
MEPATKPKPPVVLFVLGTTAVGKSKLALDLAEALNGEIVNADSMQIYKGNEGVMTAKPTGEEKARMAHHLYDIIEMHQQDFNVNKYVKLAVAKIDEILSRGKLPVVVGGTNYYIEGLIYRKREAQFDERLFRECMEAQRGRVAQDFQEVFQAFVENIPPDTKANLDNEKFESEKMHGLLEIFDSKKAVQLHSKDRRRIINALFKKLRWLYLEGEPDEVQLRYFPIINWMRASPPILLHRVTKRIDDMLFTQGGLKEAFDVFRASHALYGETLDFQKGILQAIGYKEFYPLYKHTQDLSSIEQDADSKRILEQCKQGLIQSTMDYTKYQIKWLTKRLSPAFLKSPLLLTIDLDNPKDYESVALSKALERSKELFEIWGKSADYEIWQMLSQIAEYDKGIKSEKMQGWTKKRCEYCSQELNGEKQWQEHIQTRKHKNNVHRQWKLDNPEKVQQYNEKRKAEKSSSDHIDQHEIDQDMDLFQNGHDDQ